MEARPLVFLVCEKILSDITDKNKLSYIGVFSGFTAARFPFLCPTVYLVAQYGMGQGDCVHHFEIQDWEGNVLFRSDDRRFFLDNRTVFHTDITAIEGIPFERPGQYWVKSFLNDRMMEQTPLNVINKPALYVEAGKNDS